MDFILFFDFLDYAIGNRGKKKKKKKKKKNERRKERKKKEKRMPWTLLIIIFVQVKRYFKKYISSVSVKIFTVIFDDTKNKYFPVVSGKIPPFFNLNFSDQRVTLSNK